MVLNVLKGANNLCRHELTDAEVMDRINLEEEFAKIITKQSINSYLSLIIITLQATGHFFESKPASTLKPAPCRYVDALATPPLTTSTSILRN